MKFSIRDLFLITVIVAVATAWWLDHQRLSAELAPSVAIGITPNGTPTPTLDLEFRQGSFGPTVPKAGPSSPPDADGKHPLYPHGKTEGRQKLAVYNGDKTTFEWRDAIGERVNVEGIAWGRYDKGLGDCVIMHDAKVFVEPGKFRQLQVYGRTVSVSGILRLKTGIAGSPLQVFIIEDAEVRPVEQVKSPWMTREPVANEAPSELVQQTNNPKQEKSLLEGDWILTSASYGKSGLIEYTFRSNRLTITNSGGIDKFTGAPNATKVEEWAVEIDESQSPPRLTLKSIVPGGERPFLSKYAIQFKDGELWLLADDGEPITAASFDPSGDEGRWLSGFERKEVRRTQTQGIR